jgi:hypothetical protein
VGVVVNIFTSFLKEDVLLIIIQIVTHHGAEFAFPTQTLHIASAPPENVGLSKQGQPS